jgi:hypothetical protein
MFDTKFDTNPVAGLAAIAVFILGLLATQFPGVLALPALKLAGVIYVLLFLAVVWDALRD